VIEVNLDNIPSALFGDAFEVNALVVGGLIGLRDPQVNAVALLFRGQAIPWTSARSLRPSMRKLETVTTPDAAAHHARLPVSSKPDSVACCRSRCACCWMPSGRLVAISAGAGYQAAVCSFQTD